MAYNNTDLSQEKDVQANEHPKESSMAFYKVMQRYIPIVIINLLIIIIMSYLISPLSKVATIVVKGNEAVYDQQIIEESGIRSKDSVLELMRKKDTTAENIVQNLPQVSESSVDISGFNEVIIQVKEYNTVAYIAKEQSYLRVLENGTVLDEEYNVSIGNQPVLTKFEEGAALDRMIEELSKVDMPILNLISEIELVTDRENSLFIRVYMNNGNRVLSLIPTFSEKIPYYPQMVKAVNGKKGVFDMEAGVYFTPFVDEETEESGLNEDEREALEEFNE
ncbi:cell division protein FtsQ [Atopostipes suicloacalis DSM 15692]|uniref:Cell division protein DivIB n=1 Tax=Atopostipes suicloacalis DSM 15692 TaxID=1121025 RepID=A0A1M4T0G2_9LACT|nr:cell division protein FtsQ/DivIB [Atopostipes suicloacalis]SHE37924.1 cell division protein FtsQ [Atopostipes suicloacalis DSM 15692]